jgi:hypothetical protein
MRLRAASWINPAPTLLDNARAKFPPKFPNFGKTFPYLPGKLLG